MRNHVAPFGAATFGIATLGAALLFLSCNVDWSDLSMPEEVKIETTPGLYLPLTNNLFSGEFEKYSPEKLIKDNLSLAGIKKTIGDNMSGIAVSTYEDPEYSGETPTYLLLRYPMAEMPVDLSEYMERLKIEGDGGEPITFHLPGVPSIPGLPTDSLPPLTTLIPDESERTKSTTVDIRDMADLLTSLTYTELGIKIKGNFEGFLEIKLKDGNTSGDGLALVLKGTYNKDEDRTYFVDAVEKGKTWKPSGKYPTLVMDMTLIGYPPDYSGAATTLTISPEFVLKWTEATVNPGENGTLEKELPLDFSELGGTLEGLRFPANSIKAYFYTSGLPESDAKITLASTSEAGGATLVNNKPLHEADAPELPADGPYKESIPPSSLADENAGDDGAIDLTDTLNTSLSGKEVTLSYALNMGSMVLKEKDLKESKTISAVLLIKLPLALEYHGSPFNAAGTYFKNDSDEPVEKSDYLTFEIKDFDFSDIIGDDDLLEPIRDEFKSGGVSGHLDITKISLVLANCDVSLFPAVCIAIKQNKTASDGVLIDLSDSAGKDIPITFDLDPDEPFTPLIEILLKKERSEDFATLSIKEGGKFRFGLIAEIESALDATVALQGVK